MSTVFATGLFFPEGPVALPDGTWLVVEGGENKQAESTIHKK